VVASSSWRVAVKSCYFAEKDGALPNTDSTWAAVCRLVTRPCWLLSIPGLAGAWTELELRSETQATSIHACFL